MDNMTIWQKCPRCKIEVLAFDAGTDACLDGSLSRMTRDGGADVYVCNLCGSREALNERGEKVTGLTLTVPLDEWPVSIERLQAEDKTRYQMFRSATLSTLALEELEDES